MSSLNSKLLAVVRRDPRYAYEAYEFVFQALEYTQKMLGRAATILSNEAHSASTQ